MAEQGALHSNTTDKVHKPPTTSTSSQASGSSLNPRSCVTCRRRKVRCDKHHPCSNCQKAHIECIFPAPGRAPRRPRKPPDGELLSRLRRLEGVVQSLGASVDDDPTTIQHERAIKEHLERSNSTPETSSPSASEWPPDHHKSVRDNSFGRLVVSEGRSRYVNNSFWAGLSNEVEDLKVILDESSETEDDYPTPDISDTVASPLNHNGFLFAHGPQSTEFRSLHPPPDRIIKFWNLYKDHCEPMIRVFHIPTMESQINAIKDNPAKGHKGMECLLFAIYYAALNSMNNEEIAEWSNESKEVLEARYRTALEQALARANLLLTEELVVLQAFVIYIICLRRHEDPRMIWSLCGLLTRLAITLGLHRDGSFFKLSPFETEVRRRVFWQMVSIDIRVSEDHGCDPTIMEHAFDTAFPLNIEDEDIDPSTKDTPQEREGITGMSFCLVRYDMVSTMRRLVYLPPIGPFFDKYVEVTVDDKQRWIRECRSRLEEKYLRYCDMNDPFHWVIATVALLVTGKMWLLLYHPFLREDKGAGIPQEVKDKLFITSMQSLEYALALETERKTVKWGWLFKSYSQWHALAYLLLELCVRTKGPLVMRAWQAVDATITEFGGNMTDTKRGQLWKLLRKLLAAAQTARERELGQENRFMQMTPGLDDGNKLTIAPGQPSPAERVKDPSSQESKDAFSLDFSNGKDLLATNDAIIMPYLAPTRSAEMKDAFDNNPAADNVPMGSPFFNPMPQLNSNVWAGNVNDGPNSIPMNTLSIDPNLENYNDLNVQSMGTGMYNQGNTGYMPNNVPNFNMPNEMDQNMQVQTQQNIAGDPMVSGSEDPGQVWQEWDDVMKEFELEAGQGTAMNHWQMRPILGANWL